MRRFPKCLLGLSITAFLLLLDPSQAAVEQRLAGQNSVLTAKYDGSDAGYHAATWDTRGCKSGITVTGSKFEWGKGLLEVRCHSPNDADNPQEITFLYKRDTKEIDVKIANCQIVSVTAIKPKDVEYSVWVECKKLQATAPGVPSSSSSGIDTGNLDLAAGTIQCTNEYAACLQRVKTTTSNDANSDKENSE